MFSPFPCGEDLWEVVDAVALGLEDEAESFGLAVNVAERALLDVPLAVEVGSELSTTSRPGKLARAACADTVMSPFFTHPH